MKRTRCHRLGNAGAPAAVLEAMLARCKGAYAETTLRGYRADLNVFQAWCADRRASWLPAQPEDVAAFIDAEVELVSPATLRRRLVLIAFAHAMNDLPSPTGSSSVRLALRRAARRKMRRPAQSKGLTSDLLRQILEKQPGSLAGVRDAALISVGYDTLCRSAELAAMRVEHLRPSADAEWSVIVARSKSDQAGDGRIAWLSPETSWTLQRWLEMSGISEGPLFRSLHLGRPSESAMDTSSIRRLVKRAAKRAGLEAKVARELSGHSMRVGAAQDMLVAGFDAVAIMQAGGWKTTSVLLRYVENASTKALHEKRWRSARTVL
jgi:integrase/recombinase XerD